MTDLPIELIALIVFLVIGKIVSLGALIYVIVRLGVEHIGED